MKIKKFNKRLSLNKKTIADLNNKEMKNLHGGGPVSELTDCPSCRATVCCPPTLGTACWVSCVEICE